VGKFLEAWIFCRSFISTLMGWYQSSFLSKSSIDKFIKKYHIDLSEFEKQDFGNFNAFFVRKFHPQARPFVDFPHFAAFAEGRYLAFDHAPDSFMVKGRAIGLQTLLGSDAEGVRLAHDLCGPLSIARLCPVDYHRFHAPDEMIVVSVKKISGLYRSVNPWALCSDTFCANERLVVVFQTRHFGKIALVFVGALGVGKIQFTATVGQQCARGSDLGAFYFGASTVVVMTQPGFLGFDKGLLEQTSQGIETLVFLGRSLAQKKEI
jgi:phosphatidylserine decarboxylase